MITRKVIKLFCAAGMLYCAPGHAFEWSDLWFTPEQRASKQLESQQYDQLIEGAPDANWRGLGEYGKGDYAAATQSFAEDRTNAEQANRTDEAVRAMYNQANASVLNEQYNEAIDLFDEVLDINPEHQDAKHNRDIAEQLLEQQQQQQQQSDQQKNGDEGDQDQEQQSGEENQNPDQQDSESGQQQEQQQQSDQQSDQQQSNSKEGEASDEQQSAGASEDELSQQEQEAQAAEALAAEQQAQEGQELSEDEEAQEGQQQVDAEPLTEREQANEQWLRKIPDDPAGLLQRKIQNRHLTDYPKVNDSDKPW